MSAVSLSVSVTDILSVSLPTPEGEDDGTRVDALVGNKSNMQPRLQYHSLLTMCTVIVHLYDYK